MTWDDLIKHCQLFVREDDSFYSGLLKKAEIIICEKGFILQSSAEQDIISGQSEYDVPDGFVAEINVRYRGEQLDLIDEEDLEYNSSGDLLNGRPNGYFIKNDSKIQLDVKPSAGATKQTITAFADNGNGTVKATCSSHGYSTGDTVVITGSTNFDGTYSITKIDDNNFYFTAAWVSTPGETGAVNLQNNDLRIDFFRKPTTTEQTKNIPTIREKYHMNLCDYALSLAYVDDRKNKDVYHRNRWEQLLEDLNFHNKPRPETRQRIRYRGPENVIEFR